MKPNLLLNAGVSPAALRRPLSADQLRSLGLRMWLHTITFFAFLCWSIASGAAEKPIIFNPFKGHLTESDSLVHEHFDTLYEVIDVNADEHVYRNPKGISGFGPTAPVYVEGRCVTGNVTVLFVIAVEGSVSSAYAAKTTDLVLSEVAVQSMAARQFQPAQLDGKPVSTTAGMRFVFPCPAQADRK